MLFDPRARASCTSCDLGKLSNPCDYIVIIHDRNFISTLYGIVYRNWPSWPFKVCSVLGWIKNRIDLTLKNIVKRTTFQGFRQCTFWARILSIWNSERYRRKDIDSCFKVLSSDLVSARSSDIHCLTETCRWYLSLQFMDSQTTVPLDKWQSPFRPNIWHQYDRLIFEIYLLGHINSKLTSTSIKVNITQFRDNAVNFLEAAHNRNSAFLFLPPRTRCGVSINWLWPK